MHYQGMIELDIAATIWSIKANAEDTGNVVVEDILRKLSNIDWILFLNDTVKNRHNTIISIFGDNHTVVKLTNQFVYRVSREKGLMGEVVDNCFKMVSWYRYVIDSGWPTTNAETMIKDDINDDIDNELSKNPIYLFMMVSSMLPTRIVSTTGGNNVKK